MVDIDHTVVIGIDLSFSSTALVALNCWDGKVCYTAFEATKKKFFDPELNILMVSGRAKDEDVDQYVAKRRHLVSEFFENAIIQAGCAFERYVALEGYALAARSTRIIETAELCGVVRERLYHFNIPHRIYDPLSVKIFATGDAFAKKRQMVNAASAAGFSVLDQYLEDGDKFKQPILLDGKGYNRDVKGPGVDLSDAFHIASMLRCELFLREGRTTLVDLKDHQRKVFLRVTKGNPVNILDKPFILQDPEEKVVRRKLPPYATSPCPICKTLCDKPEHKTGFAE